MNKDKMTDHEAKIWEGARRERKRRRNRPTLKGGEVGGSEEGEEEAKKEADIGGRKSGRENFGGQRKMRASASALGGC